MASKEPELQAEKTNIAEELFARTADENYITARWCAMNRLRTDFFGLVHTRSRNT